MVDGVGVSVKDVLEVGWWGVRVIKESQLKLLKRLVGKGRSCS